MSIQFDKKTKTYYVRYLIIDKVSNKRIHKKKSGFATKKDAKIFEVAIESEKSETVTSFRELAKLAFQYQNSIQETKDKKLRILELHFDELLDKSITKITKNDLLKFYMDIKNLDRSTNTKNKILSIIKSVYKFANAMYDVKDISLILKTIPKDKDEVKASDIWTIPEFNQFIACVNHPIYKAFYTTLFYTGLRRGEAIALQKSDLTDDKYLIINKSMKHYKNGFKPTKTLESNRKVKLDDNTYKMLLVLKNREGKFLFGDIEPLSISGIQRNFVKSINDSKVKKIRLHDLRHSHASILINNDINIVAVSQRLGHSSTNQTLTTYTHLMKQSESNLIDFINESNSKST